MMSTNDFPCEYSNETVRQQVLDREPIAHHRGIVILENAPIGVCNRCGAHYYAVSVLRRAEEVLKSDGVSRRTLQAPIEAF